MHATWATSLTSGLLVGLLCRLEDNAGKLGTAAEILNKESFGAVVIVSFVVLFMTTVIGVEQLREFRHTRSLPGLFHFEVNEQDWEDFYLPAWGRLIVFLVSIGATATLCGTLWL